MEIIMKFTFKNKKEYRIYIYMTVCLKDLHMIMRNENYPYQ